jgi:hypothetical protein
MCVIQITGVFGKRRFGRYFLTIETPFALESQFARLSGVSIAGCSRAKVQALRKSNAST